jgi:hypothetical protein
MSLIQQIRCVGMVLCLAATVPAAGLAQHETIGGPLTGPPILDAPFSAEATTTLQQTLGDGTRIERRATARYYRDRIGRVRVEQAIIGLEALNPAAEGQARITIHPDLATAKVYTLDPVTRTARIGSRYVADSAVGGGDTFAVPLGGPRFLVFAQGERLRERVGLVGNPVEEDSLGTQRIAGVEAVGRRTTVTVLVGQLGNDRPMQIVDERWESPQLKMVVYSRHSDPRTGVIDYRVTNIRRTEPPPDLFVIPADYVVTGDGVWISLDFADAPKGAKSAPRGRR